LYDVGSMVVETNASYKRSFILQALGRGLELTKDGK